MTLTDAQLAALNEVDRLELADRLEPLLTVGGVPYRDAEISVEATDSEPAVLLDAATRERITGNPEQRECHLDFVIRGDNPVRMAGFRGKVARRIGHSAFQATTAAYRWQRQKYGLRADFVNAPPNVVIYSALSVLQREYEGIDIPPGLAAEPKATFSARQYDTLKDLIGQAVADPPVMRVCDTARNVATLHRLGAVSGEPVWEIEEGRDCGFGEVVVETVDEERYFAVEVWRLKPDGSGDHETMARVEIDNGGLEVPHGDIYPIEYTQEDAAAGRMAHTIAALEAERRALNAVRLEAPLVYWPFWVDRGDAVGVTTRELDAVHEDRLGDWVRRYLMRADSEIYGPARDSGKLTGQGRLVSETFVPARERPIVIGPGVATALWGYDYAGRPYLDASLPWVTDDGNYVALDVGVAAEYGVTITEEPTVVEIN